MNILIWLYKTGKVFKVSNFLRNVFLAKKEGVEAFAVPIFFP